MLQLTGPMVRLSAAASELVHRLRRLFFLNEGQDFSRFLVLPPQLYCSSVPHAAGLHVPPASKSGTMIHMG